MSTANGSPTAPVTHKRGQAFNPYLPLDTYIPDGEPHIFGDRVYVFGSHDREGGTSFCMLDYEVWSAPVNDLSDWRCEGTIYGAAQDPACGNGDRYLYAPDVVQGNDGRYYLYYAMSGGDRFTGPIHVAVCEQPAGRYEYWGEVRWPDGNCFDEDITFDPGVINDDGTIRLYYGWSLSTEVEGNPEMAKRLEHATRDELMDIEATLFGKSRQRLAAAERDCMGANVVALADDMLTVIDAPRRIVPGQFAATGTSFEGHAFFEASSIRKIGDTYYFIYSSQGSHELCYATSRQPDRGFVYGGTIISNGDIGYRGRASADRLAITGNNHGSIIELNGQWYVFYHRQTHKTTFSRQGCAEPIAIAPDGTIAQVEMTSCGLNGRPLMASGTYPAPICCNLTNGHMPHQNTDPIQGPLPHIDDDGETRFVSEIENGTTVGFKYFDFAGGMTLRLTVRGTGNGVFHARTEATPLAESPVSPSEEWVVSDTTITVKGTHALYLTYEGDGLVDLKEICFSQE